MSTAKNLGHRILELRQKGSLTQEQLAKKVGLSRPSITAIEQGKRKISVEELLKFSNVLNCSVENLVASNTKNTQNPKDEKTLRDLYGTYKERYQTPHRARVSAEDPLDDYLKRVNPYYYPTTNEVKYED